MHAVQGVLSNTVTLDKYLNEMTPTIKFAVHTFSDKIVHINNVDRGLACNCKCILCHELLEARKGQVRDWHFSHSKNKGCMGGQETALHRLGKQIIVDNVSMTIPDHGEIIYSNPIAEKSFNLMRPDITAMLATEHVHFEILVTHPMGLEKVKKYIDGQLKSIEIDLSECVNLSAKEVEWHVLKNIKNKRIIYWENECVLEPVTENNKNGNFQKSYFNAYDFFEKVIMAFSVVFVILGVWGYLSPRKKR